MRNQSLATLILVLLSACAVDADRASQPKSPIGSESGRKSEPRAPEKSFAPASEAAPLEPLVAPEAEPQPDSPTEERFAAPGPLGQALEMGQDPRGRASVALLYSYDLDWGWSLQLSARFKKLRGPAPQGQVFWNLHDPAEGRYVYSWKPAGQSSSDVALQETEIAIRNSKELQEILPRLKRLQLVFATEKEGAHLPLAHFDLVQICEKHESAVRDLTNPARKACEAGL